MSLSSRNFERQRLRAFFSTRSAAKRFHHFGWLNSRHLPKEPGLGFIAKISELNEVFGGGLKKAAFPPGNRHSRTLHAASEFCLINAEPLSQGDDLQNPFGRRCALRFSLHLMFYDTTTLPALKGTLFSSTPERRSNPFARGEHRSPAYERVRCYCTADEPSRRLFLRHRWNPAGDARSGALERAASGDVGGVRYRHRHRRLALSRQNGCGHSSGSAEPPRGSG